MHKMKTLLNQKNLWFLFLLTVMLISGCAQNEDVGPCLSGHNYGFLGGLRHGCIAPLDFIGMLFIKDITMFAQNNEGGL